LSHWVKILLPISFRQARAIPLEAPSTCREEKEILSFKLDRSAQLMLSFLGLQIRPGMSRRKYFITAAIALSSLLGVAVAAFVSHGGTP
jgi:hypothetical protein